MVRESESKQKNVWEKDEYWPGQTVVGASRRTQEKAEKKNGTKGEGDHREGGVTALRQ